MVHNHENAPIIFQQRRLSTILQFPFRGGRGGLMKNDHEFPFLRIVELFERSLIEAGPISPRV